MKIKLLCVVTAILLGTMRLLAQHACCTSAGVATISVGSNAESMLMPKNTFGIELTNMAWFLKSQDITYLQSNTIADVGFVNATSIALHYGLLSNLSLSAILPYVSIQSDVYTGGSDGSLAVNSGNKAGLGDMSLIARYQLPFKNTKLPKIALMAGSELPTGYSDPDNGNVVASMGSQSWDFIFGIGLKKQLNSKKVVLSLNSNYKISTQNDKNINYGDFWNTSLLGSYKFESNQLAIDSLCNKKTQWVKTMLIGFSNDYLFKQMENDTYVSNTGYDRFYGSVGGTIGFKKLFRLSLIGDIPLFEKIEGTQNKSALRIRTSLLITFNKK